MPPDSDPTTRTAFALYLRRPGRGRRWEIHSAHPTREAASTVMFEVMATAPAGTDFNVRAESPPAFAGAPAVRAASPDPGTGLADTPRAEPDPYSALAPRLQDAKLDPVEVRS